MDDAQAAYEALTEMSTSSLRIDGVVVASRDVGGKIRLGTVTEHSTKTGLKWGLVGGVVAGLIFPPSILASAAVLGAPAPAWARCATSPIVTSSPTGWPR